MVAVVLVEGEGRQAMNDPAKAEQLRREMEATERNDAEWEALLEDRARLRAASADAAKKYRAQCDRQAAIRARVGE